MPSPGRSSDPARNRWTSPQATRSEPNCSRTVRTAAARCSHRRAAVADAARRRRRMPTRSRARRTPGGRQARIEIPEVLKQNSAAAAGRHSVVPRFERGDARIEIRPQIIRWPVAPRTCRPAEPATLRAASIRSGLTRSASSIRVEMLQGDHVFDREGLLRLEHVERELRPQPERTPLEIRGITRHVDRIARRDEPRRVVGVLDVSSRGIQKPRIVVHVVQPGPEVGGASTPRRRDDSPRLPSGPAPGRSRRTECCRRRPRK